MQRLIERGWNPPAPTAEQATRILASIARMGALTAHEERVLAHVAEGETMEEIAGRYRCTVHAVKKTEERIRLKLGARNNAHAVALAARRAA